MFKFTRCPLRVWTLLVFAWLSILSGVFFSYGFGPPGIRQWMRLRSGIAQKQAELARADAESTALEEECTKLEKSRVHQEKEIRRVLGYAASDELIFDFSSEERVVGNWPDRAQ